MRLAIVSFAFCGVAAAAQGPAIIGKPVPSFRMPFEKPVPAQPVSPKLLPQRYAPKVVVSPSATCSIPLTNLLPPSPDPPMPKIQPRGKFHMRLVNPPAPPCKE